MMKHSIVLYRIIFAFAILVCSQEVFSVEGINPPRREPDLKLELEEDIVADPIVFESLIERSFRYYIKRDSLLLERNIWAKAGNFGLIGGGSVYNKKFSIMVDGGIDNIISEFNFANVDGIYRSKLNDLFYFNSKANINYGKRFYEAWYPSIWNAELEANVQFPWSDGIAVGGFKLKAFDEKNYPIWKLSKDTIDIQLCEYKEVIGELQGRIHKLVYNDWGMYSELTSDKAWRIDLTKTEKAIDFSIGGFRLMNFGIVRFGVEYSTNWRSSLIRPFFAVQYSTPLLLLDTRYGISNNLNHASQITKIEPIIYPTELRFGLRESLSVSVNSRIKGIVITFTGTLGRENGRSYISSDDNWGYKSNIDDINILKGLVTFEIPKKIRGIEFNFFLQSKADYSTFVKGGDVPLSPKTKTYIKVSAKPLSWFEIWGGYNYSSGIKLSHKGEWKRKFVDFSGGIKLKYRNTYLYLESEKINQTESFIFPYLQYNERDIRVGVNVELL